MSECIARGEITETRKIKELKTLEKEHNRQREALVAKENAVEQEREEKLLEELNKQHTSAIKESLKNALEKVGTSTEYLGLPNGWTSFLLL